MAKRTFAGSQLIPGMMYRVITAFEDFDGSSHPVGETWKYVGHNFVPYDDGLTLYIEKEGQPHSIRLRWAPESQGHIVSTFSDYVEEL